MVQMLGLMMTKIRGSIVMSAFCSALMHPSKRLNSQLTCGFRTELGSSHRFCTPLCRHASLVNASWICLPCAFPLHGEDAC